RVDLARARPRRAPPSAGTARSASLDLGELDSTSMPQSHYDPRADIAWLRFSDQPPAVSHETAFGLIEVDAADNIVSAEYWDASKMLPEALLGTLPAPSNDCAR